MIYELIFFKKIDLYINKNNKQYENKWIKNYENYISSNEMQNKIPKEWDYQLSMGDLLNLA